MIGRILHFIYKVVTLLWYVLSLSFLYLINSWGMGAGLVFLSVRRLRKAIHKQESISLSYMDPLGHYHPLSFYYSYSHDLDVGSSTSWPAWRVIEKDPLQFKHALVWFERNFKRKTIFWRIVRHLYVSYYELLAQVNPESNPYVSHFQAIADRFRKVRPNGQGKGLLSFLYQGIHTHLFGPVDESKYIMSQKKGEELRHFAKKGMTEQLLHELKDEKDLEHPDDDGWTLLFHAMKGWQYDTVEALVKKGADLNARDILGHTMLSICARYGYQEQAEFLLSLGADVNTREEVLGRTPLMVAAYCDHPPLAQLLLKAGADKNAIDDLGETAMSIAGKYGRDEVVRVLNHGRESRDR